MAEPLNQNEKTETVGSTFFEFLAVVVKYRRFLFLFVFIITAAADSFIVLTVKNIFLH